MSRINEAMRRAAEAAAAGGTGFASESAPPRAAEVHPPEAFPIEMPERRTSPRQLVPRPSPEAPPSGVEPAAPVDAQPADRPRMLVDRMDGALAEKLVIDQKIQPASREQYRRLAAALHHAQTAAGLKVIMIASAAPGEGKTLTASNLALTFSESYQRSVLLVDADLRRPALHRFFQIDNSVGLSEALLAAEPQPLQVRRFSPRLAIVPAGAHSSDPAAGLTSDRMRQLLDEAREAFDWVIIDTPPVALLSDANLLAAMVDGAVLVVMAGSTAYQLVNRAIEAIGRQRILGVVLNRAESEAPEYAYDYSRSYLAPQPDPVLRP